MTKPEQIVIFPWNELAAATKRSTQTDRKRKKAGAHLILGLSDELHYGGIFMCSRIKK